MIWVNSHSTTSTRGQPAVEDKPLNFAIDIEGVSYRYPSDENPVLKGITLQVQPGEFIILMGATGCGKSTLSLCLNGIIPQVLGGELKGSIEVMGWKPAERPVYEMATRIGLVFQDADSQICNIFVRDEVAFGAQNLLVPKDEILARVGRVLQFVGLSEYEERPVFALSGGEKQRVAIASVLAMEPAVVVFDEPTANLDPTGAQEVQSLVRALNRERGVTTIVIEHDVANFIDIADRLVVIADGNIAYDGPPREVLQTYGRELRDKLGLRLPQVVEFVLQAREKGYSLQPFPLTINEVDVHALQFPPTPHRQAVDLPPAAEAKAPIIEMHEVEFGYTKEELVLHSVSMAIERGEILAIVGQNGSGKTTLTSLLIGLNKPSRGSITVCGLDVSQATIKELAKKVGYVFQYPEHQFVTDSVFEEMAFGLRNQDLPPSEVEQRVQEMLASFQLDHVKDRHPFALSRGQKRRLSVACMLVHRPEVFILDEPTTGQDLRNETRLMEYLLELNQQGLTIILVTHSMELVARYATNVLVMHKGQVAFQGSPGQLFSEVLATEDRYHLTTPDIFKLQRRLREQDVSLPLVATLAELAAMLVERR